MLRDCLEVTDWSVFKESCVDLNEYTEVVTSYISFCETVCVPSKAVTIYNNNKPWFNKEIKILWREKHKAFKSGDKELYKIIKGDFVKAVKKAKGNYKCTLENKLKINDTYGV